MIFESEPYLNKLNDKGHSINIAYCNACFRKGIFLCHDIFYYFILGSYADASKLSRNVFSLNRIELEKYRAFQRLLEGIKNHISKYPELVITPHIFTKFIHKIRDKLDDVHYKRIINLLNEEFGYIHEEPIEKNDILNFHCFKNKLFGLSETTLLILKTRKEYPCIFSSSGKIMEEYKEDFLFINFPELISFTNEEYRKNQIE